MGERRENLRTFDAPAQPLQGPRVDATAGRKHGWQRLHGFPWLHAPTDPVWRAVAALGLNLTIDATAFSVGLCARRHGMRVVHLIGPDVNTGLQPLCGTWGSLDSDWTSVPGEATCAACLTDIQLPVAGYSSATPRRRFGVSRVQQ